MECRRTVIKMVEKIFGKYKGEILFFGNIFAKQNRLAEKLSHYAAENIVGGFDWPVCVCVCVR